ncbi:protein of unknown function [Moritella yayanosii]|uniref:Uncharacterized protein n=1 Tax=Moritella yayanosii TaxID=69539 RepID=A0A330M0Z7_9GAMM|nr:protein of unknown function [Moritella yayanosii]
MSFLLGSYCYEYVVLHFIIRHWYEIWWVFWGSFYGLGWLDIKAPIWSSTRY